MASAPRTRTRIRGLDGLRTLAVLLVLAYHLLVGVATSGFVGVDVFFVISGFLITALLLGERERGGTIDIRAFWMRRIRRLVPAVVVATIGTVWLARLAGGDAAVQLRWQAVGAITGTYNWLEVANHSSYFDRQSPKLLTNMWSLAVEQQFYLLWPLVLWLILAFVPGRLRSRFAVIVALASVFEHAALAAFGADVTRAYVGTDSHAFGLMLGAALALGLPGLMNGKRPALSAEEARPRAIAGWLGLAGIIAIAVFIPDGRFMYPWGMFAASVCALALIRAMLPDMAASTASVTLWEFFDSKPMRWIGERSYGIYLWHWPLWVIGSYAFDFSVVGLAAGVSVLAVVLAHLSYTFVETPVRRNGFGASLRAFGRFASADRTRLAWVAAASVVLIGVVAWGFISSPNQTSAQRFVEEGQAAAASQPSTAASLVAQDEAEDAEEAAPSEADEDAAAQDSEAEEADDFPPPTGEHVTIVGDSIVVGATPPLQERLPGVHVDAAVSRNVGHVPSILNALAEQGLMRDYLVVSVTANSAIGTAEVDQILSIIGPDRRLVLVTGYGPERCTWIPPSNAQIRQALQDHPDQIRVAEWEPIAAAHTDLLAGDRVHPNPEGAVLFADEVVRALESF